MIICVFGDSLAWGAWDEELGGWVNRLKLFLPPNYGYETEVYTLGISGETTDGLLKRFEIEAKALKPDIIIFEIGKNDAAYRNSEDNPLVELEQFKQNISKLAKLAKKFTDKIIFLGLAEIDDSKTKPFWEDISYNNKRLKMYETEIKQICEKDNIYFIKIRDLLTFKDFDKEDALHPNAKGHEKIFERVKEFLVKNNWIEK